VSCRANDEACEQMLSSSAKENMGISEDAADAMRAAAAAASICSLFAAS
jgi:uncharacterized membrane protein